MLDTSQLFKAYAACRNTHLSSLSPEHAQKTQLLSLLGKASSTLFGRFYKFDQITSVEEYQSVVPLRRYEDFWEDFWKIPFPRLNDCTWPGLIPYFAVSSGTSSGTTKWIPYTVDMTASNSKAGKDLLVYHFLNSPSSRLLGGHSFILGGSTEFVEQSNGVYSGDLSGIAMKEMPWWASKYTFPSPELALLKNWEEKIDRLARESLTKDIRSISGVPSWMLILFDKLFQLIPDSGEKLTNVYPNLELIIHGGVNFSPYRKRFQQLLEGSKAELREVYPASEGFIAIADRGYGEGLRMMLDHGIFFEFVPVEELDKPHPTRHWIKNIEVGVNYAIVLTTCAGLWSYILGDTVRFVDRDPPRLLITGRTSYYLSAFGEHVIAEELEDAVSTAAQKVGVNVTDYSVGPIYPEKSGELGGHLYVVEFSDGLPPKPKLDTLAQGIDQKLCQRNEDYEAHRAKGFGLRAPEILPVPPGMFAAWMKERGKLGGQNKVPRIITKKELFDDLSSFAREYRR